MPPLGLMTCSVSFGNQSPGQPELDLLLVPVVLVAQELDQPLLRGTLQFVRLINSFTNTYSCLIKFNHLYRFRGNNSGPSGRHR